MRDRGRLWWAGTIIGGVLGALFGYVVGIEYGGVMSAAAGVILGIPFGAFIGPYLALVLAAVAVLVVLPFALIGLVLYVIGLAIQDLLGGGQ
jgi:hypothetical protein